MVDASRELEAALGDGVKRIEANEQQTVVVQRRALRAKAALPAGTVISEVDLEALRPCPREAIGPDALAQVVGRKLKVPKEAGTEFLWTDLA
jgi:N-acetylneuraminate synthase